MRFSVVTPGDITPYVSIYERSLLMICISCALAQAEYPTGNNLILVSAWDDSK